MKIWLVNPYGPIPGEGWRDYRFTILGKTLAERGHDVTWWTANFSHHFKKYRSTGWQDVDVTRGFRIRLTPSAPYRKNVGFGRIRYEAVFCRHAISRGAREPAPDCIIGADPSQLSGYTATRLARRHRALLVLDVFDLWPELFVLAFPRPLRPLAPAVLAPLYALRARNLAQADAVASNCNSYLAVALSQVPDLPKDRSVVAFSGIDVPAFRASMVDAGQAGVLASTMGKRAGEVWAVFAGTLGNNYDIPTLLEAAAQLDATSSRLRFVIAGAGPLRPTVEKFIETRRLKNTRYLGTLSHQDLARLYQACDIGLSPYSPQSTVAIPDKAYDYITAGLPIVNSLKGEFAQMLAEREIGVQYEAGDHASLARTLESLASDDDRRRRLAANAFGQALEFDNRVQFGKYADFVERLDRERRPGVADTVDPGLARLAGGRVH